MAYQRIAPSGSNSAGRKGDAIASTEKERSPAPHGGINDSWAQSMERAERFGHHLADLTKLSSEEIGPAAKPDGPKGTPQAESGPLKSLSPARPGNGVLQLGKTGERRKNKHSSHKQLHAADPESTEFPAPERRGYKAGGSKRTSAKARFEAPESGPRTGITGFPQKVGQSVLGNVMRDESALRPELGKHGKVSWATVTHHGKKKLPSKPYSGRDDPENALATFDFEMGKPEDRHIPEEQVRGVYAHFEERAVRHQHRVGRHDRIWGDKQRERASGNRERGILAKTPFRQAKGVKERREEDLSPAEELSEADEGLESEMDDAPLHEAGLSEEGEGYESGRDDDPHRGEYLSGRRGIRFEPDDDHPGVELPAKSSQRARKKAKRKHRGLMARQVSRDVKPTNPAAVETQAGVRTWKALGVHGESGTGLTTMSVPGNHPLSQTSGEFVVEPKGAVGRMRLTGSDPYRKKHARRPRHPISDDSNMSRFLKTLPPEAYERINAEAENMADSVPSTHGPRSREAARNPTRGKGRKGKKGGRGGRGT